MRIDRKVKTMLKDAGAKLKRNRKHQVYELPDGKNVVISSTPSDVNAMHSQVRDIKKATKTEEPKPQKPVGTKERRNKPGRQGEPKPTPPPPMSMADQLRMAELRQEKESIAEEKEFLAIQIELMEQERRALNSEILDLKIARRKCFWCRFREWWRRR